MVDRHQDLSPEEQDLSPEELVGKNVRRHRNRHGWSQEKLAEESGLHRTYVGSIERGERNVAVRNICVLAEALGVEPRELLKPPAEWTDVDDV